MIAPMDPRHTPGLDKAMASLIRSRVVLWAIVVLQGVALVRSWQLTRMGWQGLATLGGMVLSILLLLAYSDAIARFRDLRNQHNLERLTRSHTLIWATLAAMTLLQLL
jgi:hypothetical protein